MTRVLLGVCGGISAYKSAELVREFQRQGCEVRVILTRGGQEFVTKLTFEALTRQTVYTDLFSDGAFGTAHIETARWADRFVIAPATANALSRLARGEASDFLSVVYLAFRGPVTVAPAMNSSMWAHVAVQENLAILRERGVQIVDPEAGELACGETGPGRMAEPTTIAKAVLGARKESSLSGKHVLVTAGPTREYLDPVRFLSSPSTGKMGLAVAHEAHRRGARVTVVHGPLGVTPDFQATWVPVTSTQEMHDETLKHLPADIFVGTAAVADYRPTETARTKLKRSGKNLTLTLNENPDIAKTVAKRRRPKDLVVGFAAETEELIPHAKLKLEAKGLDLIVANEVNREKCGFTVDRVNAVILDRRGETISLSDTDKTEVASVLFDRVEKELRAKA